MAVSEAIVASHHQAQRSVLQAGEPRIATVVSYSSNERMFADALLHNASMFSDVVVLAVGERLYTGGAEDEAGLEQLVAAHPSVKLVRYPVPDRLLSTPIVLHNSARIAGYEAARAALGLSHSWAETPGPEDPMWILFLDGDEVPGGARVRDWWREARTLLSPNAVLKMLNYWLFLSPRLVADCHEDSVLLVHSSKLSRSALSHPRERDGIYLHYTEAGRADEITLLRRVPGMDARPLFWHYSWVRSDRAALHKKVQNWGHRDDLDWHSLIDTSMDDIDSGRWPAHDFVHGYRLTLLPRAQAHI